MTKSKTLQLNIVEKMFAPAEFSKFLEKYYSLRETGRGNFPRPITENDRAIFTDYKTKISIKDLAKKYAISESRIQTSILKAAQE